MSESEIARLSKKLDELFDKIDSKLTNHDVSFEKMFKFMRESFGDINKRLDETASQSGMDRLTNTVDAFVKRLDDQEIENISRDRQFDRLVAWARKVSEKTGIPLENL